MGIFRDITKSLKKAAPIIGAGIGMYFGGPMGASIGSGIGSLASGRSVEESLMNAALAGGTAYLATGAGTPGAGMKNFSTAGSPLRTMFQGADTVVNAPDAIKGGGSSGVGSFFDKLIPDSTMGKIALGSTALGLLGGMEEPQATGNKMREYSEGEYRGGKLTTLDDNGNIVDFDGGDPEQRKAYYDQLGRNQRRKKEVVTDYDEYGTVTAANGGLVKGYNAGGYANSKFSDLYRLANNVDFSEGEQRNIQSALDKRIGGRTGFDALPTERLIANTSSSGKKDYTEADIREMSGILAKRSAPKAPMMNPYMGDPSQLMRNFMVGGEVRGPGSGTSDSVPARLSDGEFVLTAKAMRGAGGGDRDVGAARMYDMMSQLEGAA